MNFTHSQLYHEDVRRNAVKFLNANSWNFIVLKQAGFVLSVWRVSSGNDVRFATEHVYKLDIFPVCVFVEVVC